MPLSAPKSGERDLGLDLAKVVACFAVIGLHVWRRSEWTLPLYHLCTFAIPVFFMANGWFLMNRGEASWGYVAKKTSRVLFTAAAWGLLVNGTVALVGGDPVDLVAFAFGGLVQEGWMSHLWFLLAISLLWALTLPLRRLYASGGLPLLVALLLVCLAVHGVDAYLVASGCAPVEEHVPQPFRLWTWAFYYVLGGFLGSERGREATEGVPGHRFAVVLAISLAVGLAFQWRWADVAMGSQLAEYWYDAPETMLASAAVLLLCRRAGADLGDGSARAVEALSGDTMGIYILHYPILRFASRLVDLSAPLAALVAAPALFALCAALSLCLLRIPVVSRLIKT